VSFALLSRGDNHLRELVNWILTPTSRSLVEVLEIIPSALHSGFASLNVAPVSITDGLLFTSIYDNRLVLVHRSFVKVWDFVEDTWCAFNIENAFTVWQVGIEFIWRHVFSTSLKRPARFYKLLLPSALCTEAPCLSGTFHLFRADIPTAKVCPNQILSS